MNALDPLLAALEQNIADDFSMERLAEAGLLSRTQLYYEFYNVTGHTMGEYIKRRRLSNALALIKTSRLPLTEIACQCGFSSQQAMGRAVRQAVGMTPLAYKKGEAYYFFPPYAGQALFPVAVKPESIPATLCLQYYDAKYKGIEERATAAFLALAPGFRGRLFGRNGKQRGSKSCYELFITDYERLRPLLKKNAFEIGEPRPAMNALFATTSAPNEEARINAAWDYLYLTWLAGSMFERTDQPYFEEYKLKKGEPVKLRLFLPIQKRADATNITLETDPVMHFIVATAKTEKAASRAVQDFLKERHPHILRSASESYLQQNAGGCTSGVRIEAPLEGHTLTPGPGHYLVLHSTVMGEYNALRERLLIFAEGNGMAARREDCFAVYDAHGGFDNLGMKLYCKVNLALKTEKFELSDKTTPAECAIINLSNR
jgi:AraC-like DNA-binding protein